MVSKFHTGFSGFLGTMHVFCAVTTGLSMFIHADTLVLVSEFLHNIIMVVQYFLYEWYLVLTSVGTFQSFILLQLAYSYDEAYYNLCLMSS